MRSFICDGRLADNVAMLLEQGLPAKTPIALVEKATWPNELVVEGTLRTIVDQARQAAVSPPAITVVGGVVPFRETMKGVLSDTAMRLARTDSPSTPTGRTLESPRQTRRPSR